MDNGSATMLVREEKLIKLLLHKDKRVRDEAVSALGRYFPDSRNVIKHLLKAFHIYEGDALGLICGMKSFLPGKEDVSEMLKMLTGIMNKQDEKSINIYFHLINSLYQFPDSLITDLKDRFVFNERLNRLYEILTNRNQIKSQSPQALWSELSKICKQNKGRNFDNNTGQYVDLLVDGLVLHGDEIKHKVIMSLSQETTDYLFELYMVQIAGRLKIQESIPYLFRILIDSDFMDLVNGECTTALGKIGGYGVVSHVEVLYPEHEHLRAQFASILKWVPYNYSEDIAIRFLKSEQDLAQKTFLAEALCGMFSSKAVDLIISIIDNKQYDPSIVNLPDLLVTIYEYHNHSLPSHDCQFFQRKIAKDFPHQEFSKLDRTIIKQAEYKSRRNDPCPCGSGKKYKKCCLNNKVD